MLPGDKVFVRTLSDHWVGEVGEVVGPRELKLINAAWIADCGRLHIFMRDGKAPSMEIEPIYHPITVAWEAVIEWPHALFTEAV